MTVHDLKRFYHRRKTLLILCPLLILGLSLGAAYMMSDKYQSSITILVEQENTLNPIVRYNLAVALVSEDRLKSFNEIIYSRSTMQMLIDTLGMKPEKDTPAGHNELLEEVRENISTSLNASDSFTIRYVDTDPERAKQLVQILSDYFIETKLKQENRRNSQTVDFFQEKLEELSQTVAQRENEYQREIESSIQASPRENLGLQTNMEQIRNRLNDIRIEARDLKSKIDLLSEVNSGQRNLSALYELDKENLPMGTVLQGQLAEYENINSRYTSDYPGLQELRDQIYRTAEQILPELQSLLFDRQAQVSFLESQQEQLTQQIERNVLADHQTSQTERNFEIYKELYNEMKVKLEQAKTNRDLGQHAQNQFQVIDPPVVPLKPVSPNRVLIGIGGLILGLLLGVMAAALAEFLDTTVRHPSDIKHFNKPVIAFIPKAK